MKLQMARFRCLAVLTVGLFFSLEQVLACSVCYGAASSSVIDGMNLSILFMLVLTYSILTGFLLFFLYLRKRARLFAVEQPSLGNGFAAKPSEWSKEEHSVQY